MRVFQFHVEHFEKRVLQIFYNEYGYFSLYMGFNENSSKFFNSHFNIYLVIKFLLFMWIQRCKHIDFYMCTATILDKYFNFEIIVCICLLRVVCFHIFFILIFWVCKSNRFYILTGNKLKIFFFFLFSP